MQDDWKSYRLLVIQSLENLKEECMSQLKTQGDILKELEDLRLRLNDQKWMNRFLILLSGLVGGAGSNFLLKMLAGIVG